MLKVLYADARMMLYQKGMRQVILAVSTPPQLKWGAEKGRIVMLVFFAFFGVGAFLLSHHILQAYSLFHGVHHLDFLSCPVDKVKIRLWEHDG